ncbi:hypothetical protein [Hyalangium versicolor]|uniref:hypothetical protein n=1 Tax=Hyalangium versicolor TaxID=2861190 RepID=UPI001CCA2B6A|nr:hypothetical protein [Hyalangium versicolor]
MNLRAPLLILALACLAGTCDEEAPLPPREAHPPAFEFSQYLAKKGGFLPGTDVLLVRRPEHLEHVYELSLREGVPGHEEAKELFGNLERQAQATGEHVAEQVYSLRCAAVELPDCVPKWRFIDELLGPAEGPGNRRLRQVLAEAFEKRARSKGLETTVVMAVVNVMLAEGMLQSAVGKAATAEGRAAAGGPRVLVETPTVQARELGAGEVRAAGVGAQRLALESGRLGLKGEVSAMEARLVEAEAQEVGTRQPAAVKELEKLRPSLERPLAGAEVEEGLWREYVSYWELRYAELTSPVGVEAGVKPPLSWPGYRVFRARFRRAMEFQAKVSALLRGEVRLPPAERQVLRGMKQPLTESNVGLKHKGQASVNYVDDLAVDEATLKNGTPHVESISTKQRDFMRMSRDDAAEQVKADGKEALAKYGGEVEVRRPGHPLFERRIRVSRVHLVYDEALIPQFPEFRDAMVGAADTAGVELHFRHAP